MRLALAALFLVGCFDVEYQNGKACSPAGECPAGFSCIEGRCYDHDPDLGVSGDLASEDLASIDGALLPNSATCGGPEVCQSSHCVAGICCDTACENQCETCTTGTCTPVTTGACSACANNVRDGVETDVDCGGSQCGKCAVNKRCNGDLDCATGKCIDTYCALVSDLPAWIALPDMPNTRTGHGSAMGPDGKVYVWSGAYNTAGVHNQSGEAYNTATATWSGSLAYITTPRYDFGMVTGPDSRIYAIGGYTGGVTASVEAYNTGNNTWVSPALPSLSGARRGLTAAVGGGHIYAFGGYDGADALLDIIESYAPGDASWTTLTTKLPVKMAYMRAATGSDGRIYISGGYDGATRTATLVFDPGTNTFLADGAPMTTGRYLHTFVTAPDGRLYAIGSTVEAYTPSVKQWHAVAAPAHGRGRAAAAVGADGRIYLTGGDSGAVAPSAYVEAYGPVVALSTPGAKNGAMVSVSGSNFARSAPVSVYFDSQASTAVATTNTDSNGVLSATSFTVPASTTMGLHTLIVIDARSQYPAFASFNVTP